MVEVYGDNIPQNNVSGSFLLQYAARYVKFFYQTDELIMYMLFIATKSMLDWYILFYYYTKKQLTVHVNQLYPLLAALLNRCNICLYLFTIYRNKITKTMFDILLHESVNTSRVDIIWLFDQMLIHIPYHVDNTHLILLLGMYHWRPWVSRST